MDKLFRLHRYLSAGYHANPESPYADTYLALEQVLDLLAELDTWGQYIVDQGGIDWEQAEKITERIIESHKTALCEHAGQSPLEAVVDFAQSYVPQSYLPLEEGGKQLVLRLQAYYGEKEEGTRP